MNTHPSAESQITRARAAGLFWLITFITGAFAMFIGGRFLVNGDAAATAANILANEVAFRIGTAGNLLSGVSYLLATILVYELLKPVNRTISLLAAFFSLLGLAGGAFATLLNFVPLALLKGSAHLSVFTPEQLQALALTSFTLNLRATAISLIFFGMHIGLVGYLFYKSAMLPRFIAVLLMIGGFGYEVQSFASFFSESILLLIFVLPGFLAEFVLTIWLLAKGVNVRPADRVDTGPPAAHFAQSLT